MWQVMQWTPFLACFDSTHDWKSPGVLSWWQEIQKPTSIPSAAFLEGLAHIMRDEPRTKRNSIFALYFISEKSQISPETAPKIPI
jgi:hypothetical protein